MKNVKATITGKAMKILPLAYGKEVQEDKLVIRLWQGEKEMFDCVGAKKDLSAIKVGQDVVLDVNMSATVSNKGYLNDRIVILKVKQ